MKKQRILAALMVLVMLFSNTSFIFAADWSGIKTFNDVGEDDWEHGYVENLASQGIVSGYGDSGNFRPDNPVSREEAAKMIALAAELSAGTGFKSDFVDLNKAGNWAHQYIFALEEAKVIQGFGTTREFRPKNSIQRGHVAKMLVKAFGLECL